MVVHHPNIHGFRLPPHSLTTAPRPETTLRELLALGRPKGTSTPLQVISGPKRLIGLKTSSATAGIKVAWGLHKFNICDFLDKHVASAYVVVLRRPHTQKHVNDTSNCEKRKRFLTPFIQ